MADVTRTATVAYNAVGNVTSRTDWRGTQTTYAYDTLHRQTSVTEAVGTSVVRTFATVYDGLGNVAARVDPLGRSGVTVFDGRSQPVTSRSPSGLLGRTQYDAAGNAQLSVDPRGNRTQAVPDALNRTLRVIDALGGVTTYLYDANGNRTGEINARGHRVTFGYDALNRQEARTDALNHTVTTVYDTAGNVRESIDQLGNRTTSSYDALNRRETVKEPLGGVVTTAYDAGSNVVNTLDQLGHKTTHVYDALGRETKTIDALNGVTSYLYDATGNRTELIDPVGNRTTFAYDALNRLIEEKDPLGERVTYAYDAAGQLSSRTDRLGRRRDYGYDADGRQTSETWVASDGSTVVSRLTFTYDGNGNRLTAANGAGTYTMVYDALNRATSVKEPFSLTLTFAYDKAGNRTEVKDSTGGIGTFTYDAANRFTRQVFTSGGLVTLQYDLAYSNRDELGFITRYNANTGTNVRIGSSLYEYDANGNLKEIIHRDGPGTNISYTINTFDTANRLWAERNALTNVRITFTYDNTDQLTGDGTRTYTYDANGNRTMSGYQTDPANRMSNDGTWTYTYDDEGNRAKKSKGASAETWEYGYDHRNQLVTAEQRATDGGTLLAKVTYTYDAWGYKVEEAVWTSLSGTTAVQRFGIDAWKTKQDGFGKDASYVGIEGADTWADLDSSSALVYRRLYTAEVDQPLVRVSAAGSMTWYLTDRQNTVGRLVDGAGTLVNTITYDRYGGKLSESNAAVGDQFAWQGQDYDAILGQYTLGVRQYDPGTGRFTSEDPSGFAAGDTNPNRFGVNSPTNATDPSGLETKEEWQAKANALLGDSGNQFERNAKITAAYAAIYLKNPQRYLWAGVGAFASAAVGEAMQTALVASGLEFTSKEFKAARYLLWLTDGAPSGDTLGSMLAKGNLAVFQDLYWQHLAYDAKGFDEIQRLYKEKQIPKEMFEGWRLIFLGEALLAGGRTRAGMDYIEAGNLAIFEYEQTVTLQNHVYNKNRSASRFIGAMIKSPVPGAPKPFIPLGPILYGNWKGKPLPGDWGNARHRWSFLERVVWPSWLEKATNDPKEIRKLLEELRKRGDF